MTPEVAAQLAERYRSLLRGKDEHWLDGAPGEIQQASFALHQHAQLYWWYERRVDRLLSWEEWISTGFVSTNRRI